MNKNIIILLDNGHGKETNGKRSPIWDDGLQLFEWEYNRKLVDAIYIKLNELTIPSAKIVIEDNDISLSERVKRVNRFCNECNCILISVHCNAGGGNGWECWTTKKHNESDIIAQTFIEKYKEIFPERKCRGHKEKNYSLLYGVKCPAVLTENFFMDNEDDCRFLLSSEGFKKIVNLHVESILEYLNKKEGI